MIELQYARGVHRRVEVIVGFHCKVSPTTRRSSGAPALAYAIRVQFSRGELPPLQLALAQTWTDLDLVIKTALSCLSSHKRLR